MTDRDLDKDDTSADRKTGTRPSGGDVGPPDDKRVDDESDGKTTQRQE